MVSSAILATWVLQINSLGWSLAFRSEVGAAERRSWFRHCWYASTPKEELLHTRFGAEYDAYLPRPHVVTDSRNLLVDPCIPLKSSMQSETHSGFAAMYR